MRMALRDRRPRRRAGDSRADLDPALRRRPRSVTSRTRRFLARTIPGCALRRVRPRRPRAVWRARGHRSSPRSGVPHRRARGARSRAGCSRPSSSPTSSARPSRRASSATAAGASCSRRHHDGRAPRARPLRRPRDRHRRRRLPRPLSTVRPGRSAAPRAVVDAVAALGLEVRAGVQHRRVRGDRRQARRRRRFTSARGSPRSAGPGEVLVSSTVHDLDRRLGDRARGPGSLCPQGRGGRAAPVRRRLSSGSKRSRSSTVSRRRITVAPRRRDEHDRRPRDAVVRSS